MLEHRIVYEEVPGSRTTQETVIDPQRERIAYEELRPGTEVQAGDQYRNTQGRWVEYSMDTSGVPIVGPTTMARRPYKISTILEIGDALANAQKAATQLQSERDELRAEMDTVKGDRMNLREALAAEQRAHKCTMEQGLAAIAERNEAERLLAEAQMQRDKAWGDQKAIQAYRDTALQELTQAREASQQLLQTIADNADQFANAGKILEHERDEARAKSERLQGLIDDLLDEPTARQVQDMLRTWATELDWSAGCFDSSGREQIDGVQKTLIAVMERIETMINPEGGTDGE